jgi:hypothetical protein
MRGLKQREALCTPFFLPPSAAEGKKKGSWGHPKPRQGDPAPLKSAAKEETPNPGRGTLHPMGADFSKERLSACSFSCRLRRQKERKGVVGDTPNPGRETLHPLSPRLRRRPCTEGEGEELGDTPNPGRETLHSLRSHL